MAEEAGTTLTKEQMAEYLALKAAQEQQAQGPTPGYLSFCSNTKGGP